MRMVWLWMACALWMGAAETLRFGLMPFKGEKEMLEDYAPIKALLEERLGMNVELRVGKDYKNILERYASQTLDLSLVNGNLYAKRDPKQAPFVYLATTKQRINGVATDYYNSLFIVKKGSKITSLADLKGKKFGFTDPGSGSGYIIPSMTLKKEGIDPEQFFGALFFLKKHDKVYGAVAAGSVDGGAVSSEIFEAQKAQHGDVFTVIRESSPLPLDVIVASRTLDVQLREKIANALLEAEHDPAFAKEAKSVVGFSRREEAFYDVFREIP